MSSTDLESLHTIEPFDLHLFLQAATAIGKHKSRDLFELKTVAACKNKCTSNYSSKGSIFLFFIQTIFIYLTYTSGNKRRWWTQTTPAQFLSKIILSFNSLSVFYDISPGTSYWKAFSQSVITKCNFCILSRSIDLSFISVPTKHMWSR